MKKTKEDPFPPGKLRKQETPYELIPKEMAHLLSDCGIDTLEKLKAMFEPGLYAVIPVSILERTDLSANAKLAYAEINALAKKSGVCFATNEYIATRVGLVPRSMTKIISELKDFELIDVKIERSQKGTYRSIFIRWGGTLSSVGGVLPIARRGHANQRIQKRDRDIEIEKEIVADQGSADIPLVIDLFKEVNPTYRKFFANKTQRAACDRLVGVHGFEKVSKVIAILPKTNKMPFIPNIVTPLQLEDGWAKLENALTKKKAEMVGAGQTKKGSIL